MILTWGLVLVGIFAMKLQLGHAVKSRSISLTQEHYNDAALVLQEVMAALILPPLE